MKRIYTYMCLLLLSVLSFAVTGCDDDDDDDVAKDLIELIVNKPVIRIGQNEEAKVNVVVGNGNYTVMKFQHCHCNGYRFRRIDNCKKWLTEWGHYRRSNGWRRSSCQYFCECRCI